jgi:hypothetical protein
VVSKSSLCDGIRDERGDYVLQEVHAQVDAEEAAECHAEVFPDLPGYLISN